MTQAYDFAYEEIARSLTPDAQLLDCGAGSGWYFTKISERTGMRPEQYFGLEWNQQRVDQGKSRGLNIEKADLNQRIFFESGRFDIVIGLSVLEHLLNGCRWIRECQRVLKPGGHLIILTPNISTYFTAALLLAGKMPSTGPHPDSNLLINSSGLTSIGKHMEGKDPDVEDDTPIHRHLVVFSYRELERLLKALQFNDVAGRGFGVYPFPNFLQPWLEKIDKIHAHQMVFSAVK